MILFVVAALVLWFAPFRLFPVWMVAGVVFGWQVSEWVTS